MGWGDAGRKVKALGAQGAEGPQSSEVPETDFSISQFSSQV